MPSTRLTSEQVRFFETFGFLGFPGLVADRVEAIVDAFEAIFAARNGHHGQGHDGAARSCILPFLDRSEYLCSLLDDVRIDAIATSLLGDDYNYMGSDGNYYVGDTGWHRDGCLNREMRHLKIAFYLDPVGRDSGALRVIPGSHRLDDAYGHALTTNAHHSDRALGVDARDLPCVALETQPGDVICFDHNTFHASFGGDARRRMFTINACQRYPENRIRDLQSYIGTYSRFWVDRVYGEAMIHTASDERMRHLAELSRQAREAMAEPARG